MYETIEQIKAADKAAGQYFFSPDTMRFFGSRVGETVINGCFFITSELDFHGHDRRYTIRRADEHGHIETVGEFRAYATGAAALRAARKLHAVASPCANCRQPTYNPNFTCDTCAANIPAAYV